MLLEGLPLPRVVAFDLDGTLIDSRADIAAACNHALAWSGRAELSADEIGAFVGDGARSLLARAARASGLDLASAELDALLAEFICFYAAHPVVRSRWMPGALDLVLSLEARGVRLALVTNKARTVTIPILSALDVLSRFDAVYAGGDGPLKPSAEPMTRIMRELASSPADTWLVGDGVQDVGAALAVGCACVAVLGGFHSEAALRAAGATHVVASLTELDAHLRRV
jgi:2-phosphoglycolate phosphatase